MLKGLLAEIRKYDSILKAEKEDFNSKKVQYEKTYGNGEKYKEVMQRVKETHDEFMREAKESFVKKVDAIFTNINKQVAEYVTKPVSEEFAAVLTSLQASGKNITEDEARLFYEQYKDNYTARKALANTFNHAGVVIDDYDRVVKSYEYVKGSIEQSRKLVDDFLRYDDDSYSHLLLLVENNNPLDSYGADITRFLGGEDIEE